jgi:alkyl sulfatase BDS1-like metallo-beta-lactamase superfamily hydrolase
MSQLQAEVLCPGHGPPILGAARVRRALDETAEFLESLCAQTLAMMNEGATLDDILHAVQPPAHLEGRPYLRPVYDEPAFIVRNLWRQYGGWYDGNPAHLKPAPEALLARELAALAGGAHRLAERALQLAADGDLPLASHLAEFAWKSSPEDPELAATRRQIYARRGEAETSLMARGIFRRVAEGEP